MNKKQTFTTQIIPCLICTNPSCDPIRDHPDLNSHQHDHTVGIDNNPRRTIIYPIPKIGLIQSQVFNLPNYEM